MNKKEIIINKGNSGILLRGITIEQLKDIHKVHKSTKIYKQICGLCKRYQKECDKTNHEFWKHVGITNY